MNITNVKQLIGSMETILTLLKQELVNEASVVPPTVTPATTVDDALICPDCGAEMALRTNRTTGNKFWGCKKYPTCRGTRDENGLSRAEREEAKYKKDKEAEEGYPQTDGFAFNKRNPVTEVSPPAVDTVNTGWINPFGKK